MLSNPILEGMSNKEIEDYYLAMGFDKKYSALNNDYLYSICSDLKKAGLLNKDGLPIKTQITPPPKSGETPKNGELEDQISKEKKGEVPPSPGVPTGMR